MLTNSIGRTRMLLCILSFLCFSWLASAVLASIFGTVRGIVHDSQHHPIASAHVVLRARASDWQKEATTDDEGRFQIDAVSAGEYTIHITHEGFRNFDGSLAVSADSAPLLHFPLELATLTQRIEVNDGTDLVDTSSSTSQTTLTRETIEATPGATRANSLDFIANFTPGAYMVHDQLHVRGGHQVSWLVDGVPVPNTNIASNVGPQFDPKDIDVVEVQRGGYSAEYGDRTFGVFNVIPRSGFERNREIELAATYGNFHSTDSQIGIGDHTDRFAYYLTLSGNRTDVGLMTPEPEVPHDNDNGVSSFASFIFNATPNDQLRLVASSRADYFQVPNTAAQEAGGIRDVQRERDAFANFSWVHTAGPGILFTLAPFHHWNHAAYDGSATDHRDSHYQGGITSLAITRGRHNARIGLYGFAQQDDARFGTGANECSGNSFFECQRSGGRLLAAFAEDQFRLTDWLTFNGGLRFTHFAGSLEEDKTSPRAGGALRVPRLHWVFRAFYGRYYQAPPLSTVSGPLLQSQGFSFLPLHGETDEQREFGLAIPFRGWTLDVANFQTHARNYFDHDVLGNSNIFFPVTIERARIHGWEATVRSPRLAHRAQLYLTYAHQFAEAAGGVTGGLTDFTPPPTGFFFLDHDQRDTLNTGFHVQMPWRAWASGNLGFGSGFLNGNGPAHLPSHAEFSFSLGKQLAERLSLIFTAQNVSNSRYLLDNSNTFGGTHWNYPRQLSGELRYRFHF